MSFLSDILDPIGSVGEETGAAIGKGFEDAVRDLFDDLFVPLFEIAAATGLALVGAAMVYAAASEGDLGNAAQKAAKGVGTAGVAAATGGAGALAKGAGAAAGRASTRARGRPIDVPKESKPFDLGGSPRAVRRSPSAPASKVRVRRVKKAA